MTASAASQYRSPQLYVDGKWIAETDDMVPIVNPATGDQIGLLPCADPAIVQTALASADRGFKLWSAMPLTERAKIMLEAAAVLRESAAEAAAHLVMEMGKPLAEARVEIENCALLLEWSPANASAIVDRVLPERAGFTDLRVIHEPIGPVAAFSPWNFPASLATRKVASAMAVGCSVIARPPSETPAAFGFVAAALEKAGLPAGVLNVLYGNPEIISYPLIDSDVIRKVAFTGSTHVGCLLAARAGAKAKSTVMELGGHAPVIISNDVEVAKVADLTTAAAYRNSGQVCVSPTRFFVHEEIHDEFAEALSERVRSLRVGDGLEPDTQMGPLANARRVDEVHELISDAVERGAELLCGGNRMNRQGNFYMATVLKNVPDDARIMHEEPFGPVTVLNSYTSLDDAIRVANSTPYALGAYGFAQSAETADRLARELDAGMVGINSFVPMVIDSPISGRRFSGYGCEGGPEGLSAYTITRFVTRMDA
jgi:succinate-semialdehyde dehydrogenase/glutarate-semialdehyde dehydrogenase